MQFYAWDMLVHRWGVARALDGDDTLSAQELDRIEMSADSFGEALHMDGICGPAVPTPPGADRRVQILVRIGRDATVVSTQR